MRSNEDGNGRVTTCRFCDEVLTDPIVDLGMSPLCESYLHPEQLNVMDPFYPLYVLLCRRCWLVHLEQYVSAEDIFTEYAYFSPFSESWVQHARSYTEKMIDRFGLGPESQVVELASNDGYLLQWFVNAGVRALGIEPAVNVAVAAEERGVTTLVRFFGRRGLYRAFGGRADLHAVESALLWVMSSGDGEHTLLDVAERSSLPFEVVDEAARALEHVQLERREAYR
jgi:hypothetical protein